MKVGILQFFGWRDRSVPLIRLTKRHWNVSIMDQTGYDAVWLAEHHFSSFSVALGAHDGTIRGAHRACGSARGPWPRLQPAAPRRGGGCWTCSGGRVNWGAAAASSAANFPLSAFRARKCRPSHETVDIVLQAGPISG